MITSPRPGGLLRLRGIGHRWSLDCRLWLARIRRQLRGAFEEGGGASPAEQGLLRTAFVAPVVLYYANLTATPRRRRHTPAGQCNGVGPPPEHRLG
eukprot:1460378-Alexandrium_andersonii.AAC.1